MAKQYSAPIPAPDWPVPFDLAKYRADEAAYIKQLQDLARQNGKHEALGMLVRFPYADSHAQYVVWNVKPLELVVVETGDAWTLPDMTMRGIRLSDITSRGGRMPVLGPVD